MPKNFEDLTPTQVAFLEKYLRTGGWFRKTEDLNEAFNANFDAAVTPLYKKINKIEATIADMEKRFPHAPASLYLAEMTEQRYALNGLINTSKKLFKKRELPDFSPISAALDAIEAKLDRRMSLLSGDGDLDAATSDDQLRADKEACAEREMSTLDHDEVQTKRVFKDATEARLLAEDVIARDNAIASYAASLKQARSGLSALYSGQAEDPSVDLPTFRNACRSLVSEFMRNSDDLVTLLQGLKDKPTPSTEELSTRLARDHSDLDMVKSETARIEGVESEITKVSAALEAQNDKLAALNETMKTATKEEQIRMRGERAALNAHIEQIEMREAQLKAFQDQQQERKRMMLVAAGEAAQASDRAEGLLGDGETNWLDVKLSSLLDGMVFAEGKGFDSPTELFSDDEMRRQLAATRAMLKAASERVVVIPRLSEDEPRMTEISASELETLNKMLDAAVAFLDTGRTDLAYALQEEVLLLRRKFTGARDMLKLPPPIPPAPSPAQTLINELTVIVGILGDKWGAGADGALALMNRGQDLISQIKETESNRGFEDDPTVFDVRIANLRREMDALAAPPAETQALTEAKAKAIERAARLDGFLEVIVKSEKLPDDYIMEEPGVEYSRAEKKRLVRPDEILTVRNKDGELEKHHMIMDRKGKGGEDHAKYDNWVAAKIPMEVNQGLHTRSETLRMMAESGAPGSEEAIEKYGAESLLLFDDIHKNGPRVYPAIKELIKRCDKILTKGTVAEFMPDNAGEVKNRYESFKSGYLDKSPTKAEEAAADCEAEITELEAEAEKVKLAYGEQKTKYGKIIKDLKGNKNKSDEAVAVGKLMQKILNSDPNELFHGTSDGADEETNAALVLARNRFDAVKTFYEKNPSDMSDKQMSGPWLSSAESAFKKLESKVMSNITEAGTELDGIRLAMTEFYGRMDGMDTATGADLAAKLIEMCEKLHLSAKTASDDREARREFAKTNAELKDAISAQSTIAGKRGKNPIAEQFKSELSALESRRSSTQTKVEGEEDYAAGMADLEEMQRDLDAITDKLGDTAAGGSKRNIKKMKISDKIPALETFVDRMKTTASNLAEAEMRRKVAPEQEEEYTPKIAVVETSLRRISALPDLGKLRTLSGQIDAANASDAPTKADRVKWREQALTEIRKLRTSFEMDPAVQIYAKNPFDLGTDLRVVRTALQQVEVAVLVSVDPKETE